MPRLRKLTRPNALLSTPMDVYEVDGVALSEDEVNLAKLLIDKLGTKEKNGVMDFKRVSTWRLRQPRSRKN